MTKMRSKIKALRGLDLTSLYLKVQGIAHEWYKVHDEDVHRYGDEMYRDLIMAAKPLPERLAMIAYLYATTADVQSVLWDDHEFVRKAVKPGGHPMPTDEILAEEEFNRFSSNFKTLAKAYLKKKACVLTGIVEYVYLCGDYEMFNALYPVTPRQPHVFASMGVQDTRRLIYSFL